MQLCLKSYGLECMQQHDDMPGRGARTATLRFVYLLTCCTRHPCPGVHSSAIPGSPASAGSCAAWCLEAPRGMVSRGCTHTLLSTLRAARAEDVWFSAALTELLFRNACSPAQTRLAYACLSWAFVHVYM